MNFFLLKRLRQLIILYAALLTFLSSCSIEKQISQSAKADVLDAKALQTAHVGISIFDPSANKYLYNYQGDKYFVPASNIKIPTCYAAMKYLGDSLVGLRYENANSTITIVGTGDPTFLHPDYKRQPVLNFLKSNNSVSYLRDGDIYGFLPLGNGWTWNDYQSSYSAERSEFPIYGNVVTFYLDNDSLNVNPRLFFNSSISWLNQTIRNGVKLHFNMVRDLERNFFHGIFNSKIDFSNQQIPFKTIETDTNYKRSPIFLKLLEDTIHKQISSSFSLHKKAILREIIHSQPTDSLLKPMMHRSDNFFAEQSLLMVSNEVLGVMNDEKIIDTLLKTDFKDLPQKPRWVDGSGLSRYNLFTPQDLVAILNKMKNEFGMERIKVILVTGGEGTISSYYKADSGYIYGKTGTLSGVVAFSGFLYTKKGKLLIFSTLVNNHQATSTEVRKAMEKFIQGVRNRY